MIDMLGNQVNEGDTIIIAVKAGSTAQLARAFVKLTEVRPQFPGGAPANMLYVEWSNLSNFWIPASKVLKLTDEMIPEKRREKLNATEEAIQP